jgi:hypothetical protein
MVLQVDGFNILQYKCQGPIYNDSPVFCFQTVYRKVSIFVRKEDTVIKVGKPSQLVFTPITALDVISFVPTSQVCTAAISACSRSATSSGKKEFYGNLPFGVCTG